MKILKLKPTLQRSLTHPPYTGPEGSSPQGGSPSSRLDSELVRTLLASSLYHTPSDSSEAALTGAARDSERPPVRDQLRDPRLLRRMGLSPEARGNCLRDPEPLSPQQPGATLPSEEPSFPVSPQALGSTVEQSTATGSSHRPRAPCEPPAASTDPTVTSACDRGGGHSHQRETRAFSDGHQDMLMSVSRHAKRSSGWDDGRPEKEDRGSKRRKL